MRCIVTGGAGFVGSNLALFLEKEGWDVIVIDRLSSGKRENLSSFKGKIIESDVSKPLSIEGDIDVIFHQAAITDPRHDNDEQTINENIGAFKLMIKLAQEKKAKLIYASSASMYGNGPSPQQEDQEKDLLSAYAKSKLAMDDLAADYFDNMHIVGLRYFNVFGPNEAHKGRPASMIYHLTKQMKQGKRPRIFKMGEQKRDHIYVKDCVHANIKALDAPSGVYNVGTGRGTSFNEVVAAINNALGLQLEPEYIDNPYDGTYQNDTCADITKAKEKLGFSAQYSFQEAVNEYVEEIQ